MEEALKSQIKKKILSRIDLTKDDVADLEEMTKPIAPENAIGRISRMDAINNKSVNEASLRNAQAKLSQLEDALYKIDNNEDFGKCRSCGNPIQEGRLLLMPESPFCVPCARI